MNRYAAAAIAAAVSIGSCAAQGADAPLAVPFDFSHRAIAFDVMVKGQRLHMFLDTGVDPSVIDLSRADALGLKVDRGAGGEASGEGDAKESKVYPTTIDGLALGGRSFAPIDALAFDMATISAGYGSRLDGVLGYSFLRDKIVLIDYARTTLGILDRPADAWPAVRACRLRYTLPIKSFEGDQIPVIADFRLGAAHAPASLDTGSNGGISLFQGALDLPGVRGALAAHGESVATGARGRTTTQVYVLNLPVGFGPFTLPAGQTVTLHKEAGSADTHLANIGNPLFAAMQLKMLLDYRARLMTFYGDCR